MANQIHAAVCAMLADVEAIKKERDNKQQGYKFRGIDDVYNAVHPLLAKHRVFPACEIVSKETSERQTKAGGALFCVSIKAKYTFYAEDGSSVATEALGDGMDSADKASNKAMSAAYKYALFQLLCIPTEAVDSEADNIPDVASKNAKSTVESLKEQGHLTTGDKVEQPVNSYQVALATLRKYTKVSELIAFAAWIKEEKINKRVTDQEYHDLNNIIAAKSVEFPTNTQGFEATEKLLRQLLGEGRLSQEDGMELSIKLEDAKEAKLGAAA